MSIPFEALFAPLVVGGLQLPNRIMLCTHGVGLSVDGEEPVAGERYARYLARRAEGGAGLLCLGSSYASVSAVAEPGGELGLQLGAIPHLRWAHGEEDGAAAERYVDYLNVIAAPAQEAGARVFAQLLIGPSRSYESYGYSVMTRLDYLTLSASEGSTSYGGVPSRELSVAEIGRFVAALGDLVAVISRSRIDGVELHAHAGDLHTDFMSPAYNRRRDEYGGGLENRMRFTLEMLASARRAARPGFPIALRFSPFEDYPGGLGIDEGVEMARMMQATGNLDLLNVYGAAPNTTGLGTPDMTFPEGLNAAHSERIRTALGGRTPVVCGGRIGDPRVAERILADDQADMVGLVRALIADPDWPRKAREGRSEEIRRCCFSNEGCIALRNGTRVKTIACTVNPEAAREWEIEADPAPAGSGRILIVGGGPAGMKAAEQLAQRGFSVALCERERALGGQVRVQARARARALEAVVVEDLERRLHELEVEIRLATAVDADSVMAHDADAVILATGSSPVRCGYTNLRPELAGLPGAARDFVVTDVDVLSGVTVGRRVLVVEDSSGGDATAPTVVDHLLDGDHEVTVLTTDITIGRNVLFRSYQPLMARLYRKGIRQLPHTGVREIGDHRAVVANVLTGEQWTIDDLDTVVLVLGRTSRRDLWHALHPRVPRLFEVGDAIMPRSVGAAVLDGHRLGRTLSLTTTEGRPT